LEKVGRVGRFFWLNGASVDFFERRIQSRRSEGAIAEDDQPADPLRHPCRLGQSPTRLAAAPRRMSFTALSLNSKLYRRVCLSCLLGLLPAFGGSFFSIRGCSCIGNTRFLVLRCYPFSVSRRAHHLVVRTVGQALRRRRQERARRLHTLGIVRRVQSGDGQIHFGRTSAVVHRHRTVKERPRAHRLRRLRIGRFRRRRVVPLHQNLGDRLP